MIDPIGVAPGQIPGGRVENREPTKVGPIQAARAPEPAVVAQTSAREAAKQMAARPPVDQSRVQMIKKALQEGRYPLVPAKIADRMIAAQMKWAEKK